MIANLFSSRPQNSAAAVVARNALDLAPTIAGAATTLPVPVPARWVVVIALLVAGLWGQHPAKAVWLAPIGLFLGWAVADRYGFGTTLATIAVCGTVVTVAFLVRQFLASREAAAARQRVRLQLAGERVSVIAQG